MIYGLSIKCTRASVDKGKSFSSTYIGPHYPGNENLTFDDDPLADSVVRLQASSTQLWKKRKKFGQ